MTRFKRTRGARGLAGTGTVLFTIVVLYLAATAGRVYLRKYYIFLPDYVRWTLSNEPSTSGKATHLMFIFVDHFEPGSDAERVREWGSRYRVLAARHRDSAGRPPQHTFFFPGDQLNADVLRALKEMTAAGFGEVELHYHHDYDTASTFRPKVKAAIHEMQQYGFLETTDGETRFAFIHGNWGLDNSNGPLYCGVNDELRLLRELGCFADFTFPSVYEDSQPPFVNTLYAARDDSRPKSYQAQMPLSTLADGSSDLLIFEGPLIFSPSLNPRHLFLDLDDGDIHPAVPPSPRRVDRWVRADVHVRQRPDWIFVKVFAHGISTPEDEESVLGESVDRTLSYLEHQYNDGRSYVLHYVTAREAYNLVRAAVDGATGNPDRYLDYVVKPYVAGS